MAIPVLDAMPDALADTAARQVREVFPEPTLIRLTGDTDEFLFVSILLHGNETVGYDVLRRLAAWLPQHRLHRGLIVFVGNVTAAASGLRALPGQHDFNRVWRGAVGPESDMAREVLAFAAAHRLFASIDIHNNTGRNPLYACINRLDPEFLYLASLFSRRVVFFQTPASVQSMAFADLCPSVTLECGQPGNPTGVNAALDYVIAISRLTSLATHADVANDIDVYHTLGRVELVGDPSIVFGARAAANPDGPVLRLPECVDDWNFSPLERGHVLAEISGPDPVLRVMGDDGRDLTARLLNIEHDVVRLAEPLVPAMLTRDIAIMRNDCLGYLMETVNLDSDARR
ncbi:MAG: peptidase M14 [Gammaproteobacteria bacterium]|nr:succinylglutamate desuccinylase/aspartoacylase family protein [Gammaproteobacteria bacterium]NNM01754.1 peptidase M14 [Gammaproteobacteria bacterium]